MGPLADSLLARLINPVEIRDVKINVPNNRPITNTEMMVAVGRSLSFVRVISNESARLIITILYAERGN